MICPVYEKHLPAAMEKFNNSNTTSKTKFQALNMVFASAVAEITAAEDAVNKELKPNAIQNALYSAFLETIGIINTQFASDIKNLIYTLAHTTSNGVSTASVIKV
ncbi:hypothetical protein AVEN_235134-1 [Araneus ventricosus]|uniref:Spidroin N-terminal domain-containing protein n=1 Tax=Araneus ventricosus TaxID=182803 RepID=A0A4Y2UEJ0_ARAVE|nr:hypothetical protein AVEN_235134-1 [Araneus ventricosus]